jgi:acyl-CoA synthetase (AMP-forming)/AMP-acid ligase II
LVVDYGLAFTGVVKVPLNARFSRAEVARLLADSGARAVLSTPDHAELLAGLRDSVPSLEFVIADGVASAIPRSHVSASPPPERWHGEADDILALRFSGGTTGTPKAAIYTHGGQILASICYQMQFTRLTSDDLCLLTQPFSHGSSQWALPAAMAGATLLMQPHFDVDHVLDDIELEGVTVIKIVPTMLFRLLQEQQRNPRPLERLRLISYGAAPMPEELLRKAMDLFPCGFSQTYGTAEASAAITSLTVEDHEQERKAPGTLLRSVGRPYPIVDIAIVDDDGNRLNPGEVGEVTVSSPMIMSGYWNDPDQTAEKRKGHRVHTGDVGRMSEDGYLYLVGRKNDLINSGGYNVYPGEVEEAMRTIPGIRDVAVTCVPDEEWGERVVAAVVLDDGAHLAPGEIIAGTRAVVAGYKTPKEVLVVRELPLTVNGKADRKLVKTFFEAVR